jgi:hypothetical protein
VSEAQAQVVVGQLREVLVQGVAIGGTQQVDEVGHGWDSFALNIEWPE